VCHWQIQSKRLAGSKDSGTENCILVQTLKVGIIDVESVVLKRLSFKDVCCHVNQVAPKAKLWIEHAKTVAQGNEFSGIIYWCQYDPMSIQKGDGNW